MYLEYAAHNNTFNNKDLSMYQDTSCVINEEEELKLDIVGYDN